MKMNSHLNIFSPRSPVLGDFIGEFYQMLRKKNIHIIQLLQQIEAGRHFNGFIKANITLIPKQDMYITRNKSYCPICFINIDAIYIK